MYAQRRKFLRSKQRHAIHPNGFDERVVRLKSCEATNAASDTSILSLIAAAVK
jgi:hypothetical protein